MIRGFKGRALLADEMGLGKTVQALYYIFKKVKARPAIVVCPAGLKYNWQDEAERFFGMTTAILSGRKPKKGQGSLMMRDVDVIIINYEILKGWIPFLLKLHPKILVIEESHYIQNPKSQRAKATKELSKYCPRIIGISGTPLTNRPAELWSVLSIIRPDLFDSFFKFAFKFCQPKKTPWGWQYTGAKNLDKLHALLTRHLMIRRRKVDVLKDLPDKTRSMVVVDLPNHKEYDMAEKNFKAWYQQSSKMKKHKLKAEALVKLGALLRLACDLKLEQGFEWIDNFLINSDEKLVIFSGRTKIIRALTERYKDICVFIDGSVPMKKRKALVAQFQNDSKTRIIIGQHRAMGVGLTMTAASSLLMFDTPWSPGELNQCEDRIHRIGQLKKAFIYYLVARNTVEEKKCKVLRQKQEILGAVLDGDNQTDNLDVFNALIKTFNLK